MRRGTDTERKILKMTAWLTCPSQNIVNMSDKSISLFHLPYQSVWLIVIGNRMIAFVWYSSFVYQSYRTLIYKKNEYIAVAWLHCIKTVCTLCMRMVHVFRRCPISNKHFNLNRKHFDEFVMMSVCSYKIDSCVHFFGCR